MQVPVARYPGLRGLCWNRPTDAVVDGRDALALYERNWRFLDYDCLDESEKTLLKTLVALYGNGVLNV